MTSSSLNRFIAATLTFSLALPMVLVSPARAGGPIGLCAPGVPMIWPAGGVAVPFSPDQGNLGPFDNASATALVQSAFDVWSNLPSSSISFVNTGPLPVDVDISNFGPYLSPVAPDGLSAIVYDDTGEIFDLLFGPGSGVLGFAGPEWVNMSTCNIIEGLCFLNGPAFTDPVYAFDVMVHEFGHYSGLGHTVVNGQILLGDNTGPTPDDATFGSAPNPFTTDYVETMYPFYFGPGIGTASPEMDDIAAISELYPDPGFSGATAAISGVIFAPNGSTRLTGVNVIARNVANPFLDAVSAISGDRSEFSGDPFDGVYKLAGLTPGASYAVYIDQIVAGGFSTPPITLASPEEFHNGPSESNNLGTPDPPLAFIPVSAPAGSTAAGINIILNSLLPGTPLPLGDDEYVEVFLPFPFRILGQTFVSVFINSNGNLTFGGGDGTFVPSTQGFLDGFPRIAGLWTDLNPAAGGTVIFTQTASTFTVTWSNVPRFPNVGANSFSIILKKASNTAFVEVKYGSLTSTEGLAGLSGGYAATSGTETPIDLRTPTSNPRARLSLAPQAAIFQLFTPTTPVDLGSWSLLYSHDFDYTDSWAGANGTFAQATSIILPFESSSTPFYTEIEPAGTDVDFFKFHAEVGEWIQVEITRGALDTVAGIFNPDGSMAAVDDDGGIGALSVVDYVVATTGIHAVGISSYPNFGFTGAGGSGGRYVVKIKKGPYEPEE